jgi:glucose/arabinose dehydrogenase
MSLLLVALLAFALALAAGCGSGDGDGDRAQTAPPAERGEDAGALEVETVATGLEAPWEIAFLPDRRALVTERPGRVRLLSADGELRDEPLAEIDVEDVGEGGLLGLAVDPEFSDNGFVYLYRTTREGNQVVRHRLDGDELREERVVAGAIPSGTTHNGGRIAFSPDGDLFVTTGDAGRQDLAQDAGSLAGKILRLDPGAYRGDGGDPEIHSLGHRNPQGLAWEPEGGRLLASEHGASRNDEVNVIERGENYGWPEVEGPEHGPFTAPLQVWTDETVAPSGSAFVTGEDSAWRGDLLVSGLRGTALRRLTIDGDEVTGDETILDGEYGRLRTVVQGPGGALYVLTNNRDGRGSPAGDDDRVLRVRPPGT